MLIYAGSMSAVYTHNKMKKVHEPKQPQVAPPPLPMVDNGAPKLEPIQYLPEPSGEVPKLEPIESTIN